MSENRPLRLDRLGHARGRVVQVVACLIISALCAGCFFPAVVILGRQSVDGSISGRWKVMMNPDFKGNRTVEDCLIREAKGSVEVRRAGGSGKAMHGVIVGRKIHSKIVRADGVEVRGKANSMRRERESQACGGFAFQMAMSVAADSPLGQRHSELRVCVPCIDDCRSTRNRSR
jgi:hypothetical protein